MAVNRITGIARIALVILAAIALLRRYSYGTGFQAFAAENFFAYLTIQSNIAALVVTGVAAMTVLQGRSESRTLSTARLAVACFQLVAGIVFGLMALQAPLQGYRLDVPWSDQILHFWLPGFALADWILSGRQRVRWRVLPLIVGYPTVWGLITIARGSIIGWYPYFFLDPAQVSPGGFVLYSTAALVLFAGVAAGLIVLGRVNPSGLIAAEVLRNRRPPTATR